LQSTAAKNDSQETGATTAVTDRLPSWNEGASKQAIIEFVKNSIDSTSKGLFPLQTVSPVLIMMEHRGQRSRRRFNYIL